MHWLLLSLLASVELAVSVEPATNTVISLNLTKVAPPADSIIASNIPPLLQ